MTLSPDSPSIIAISITAITFTLVGLGIRFSHVGTPAARAIPDAIAQKSTQAPAIAIPANPPVTGRSPEASVAKPQVRDMELWWQSRQMELRWQSTHHQRPRHNSPKRLDAANLAALSARVAEASWGSEPGRGESPRYLSDTSRWPLHGPGLERAP
jgi:hypothetical protein